MVVKDRDLAGLLLPKCSSDFESIFINININWSELTLEKLRNYVGR